MKVVEEIRVIHDRSGFGIIHEVRVETGETYARKTFRPNLPQPLSADRHEELKRRFSREVRTQQRLSSDYCIPIVYSELNSPNPWFLMPIADKTFDEEIAESKLKRTVPDGLSDILNCLEYIHQRGYTHRDIKPGNILLHEGSWKLADMGLITADPELTTSFMTESGVAYGSNLYMAPEQLLDFNNVDYKADIYSFGAILHDIFSGLPRTYFSKLSSSGPIGVIIEKCTEENPDDRFPNVTVLRDVLLSKLTKAEINVEISVQAEEWLIKIKDFENWKSDDLDSFAILVDKDEVMQNALFYDINNQFISGIATLNERYWNKFVRIYISWIDGKGFDFNYCDALISHILNIYNTTTDISIKSDAIFSGAELASSHNRFFCMRKVVEMSSPVISDVLAERVSIEIYAKGAKAKSNLKRCVVGINRKLNSYHLLIEEALTS